MSLLDDLKGYEKLVRTKITPRVVMPVKGARISQGVHEGHVAIDFAAPLGTPVVAPVRGVVTSVQDLKTGYGRHVRVRTSKGETLIFGHLQGINVKVGQPVSAGMQLGTIGSTGFSTRPHLHFERRETEYNPIDPWALLKGAREIDPTNPNATTLNYGLPPAMQPSRGTTRSTMKVSTKRAAPTQRVVSTPTARSAPTSINYGKLPASFEAEDQGQQKDSKQSLAEATAAGFVKGMTAPFERAAVGAIGIVLIVVGLFIFSSGLREQSIKIGKEVAKTLAGAAAGGPAGAVAGAVA